MALKQWADGLWTLDGDPIRYLGFPYELRMTIVRLDDGGLWLHSPVQCTAEATATVDALGPVRHLVTPNKLHHLFLGEWAARHPDATVYLAPGLRERRPDLRCDAVLGDTAEPPWRGVIDQCVFGPSLFMDEVVFFHRPSRTLILGDLVENHDPALLSGWRHGVAKLNRMLGPRAETPVNWRITFTDRRRTRSIAERIVAWRPEHVIVMHGSCVEHDADAWLRHALGWVLEKRDDDGHVLDRSQVERFYDAFGKRQDWQAFYEDEPVARMVASGRFRDASAVFELGCGTGRIAARLLAAEMPTDARYVGVDVSKTMVQLASARLSRFGGRCRVRAGDGSDNPDLPSGSFDRFVSTYVLDLMSERQRARALDEAHRLLAPGGLACLVSLTHADGGWGRVVERAWMAAWRRAPDLVGGCRPIELLEGLPEHRWEILDHAKLSAYGLWSEVVVAAKR